MREQIGSAAGYTARQLLRESSRLEHAFLLDRTRQVGEANVHLATDEIGERGCQSAIGHVRHANTTLADLLTPLLVADPFSAVRASLRWWSND